jgi:glycogen debranching enzyme
MPECLDKKYEALYYKALSVNKVNVHTAEGKIDSLWTTPDRVPHRHMWMWDSVFHAMAIGTYNIEVAKEILLAMLKQMRENGFMPHMANPTDCSDVTQPCVMSFGVYEMYKLSKDKEYIKQCLPYLDKYLTFDMENRDVNKNGLLEWLTEPEYIECKCGESGLDNSPRFDFDEEMDCIDFSSFFALDTHILSLLYKEVGDIKNSKKWEIISKRTARLINNLMWDEKDGVYYDCLFSGELTKVLTPTSFLPMFASISSKEQAKKMVKALTDEKLLWSKCPVASISQQDPRFSNDMWRGGVWANLNYFIIKGLKNYGYNDLANLLRDKTLDMINKWYQKSGCIFEFFDPKDETHPLFCHRKGDPLLEPDYRKHVHSISDYNWSACFAILLIQGLY